MKRLIPGLVDEMVGIRRQGSGDAKIGVTRFAEMVAPMAEDCSGNRSSMIGKDHIIMCEAKLLG